MRLQLGRSPPIPILEKKTTDYIIKYTKLLSDTLVLLWYGIVTIHDVLVTGLLHTVEATYPKLLFTPPSQ